MKKDDRLRKIKKKIEKNRELLNNFIEKAGPGYFDDGNVLGISKKLDSLLNDYEIYLRK
jgi:hypothetical protein